MLHLLVDVAIVDVALAAVIALLTYPFVGRTHAFILKLAWLMVRVGLRTLFSIMVGVAFVHLMRGSDLYEHIRNSSGNLKHSMSPT